MRRRAGDRPRSRPGFAWSARILLACIASSVVQTAHAAEPRRTPDDLIAEIRQRAAPFPRLSADPYMLRTLQAIRTVSREAFLPPQEADWANVDSAVPIGYGQTASAPGIVALMTAATKIRPGSRVLEIGTGSGYQAAILSKLGAVVHSIEIVDELAASAAARLSNLGYANVELRSGDGFAGWSEQAPFDAILVTAGSTDVPPALLAQLAVGGRLVMPIGPVDAFEQLIVVEKRADGSLRRCSLGFAMFVPLTGVGAAPLQRSGEVDLHTPYCYGRKEDRR